MGRVTHGWDDKSLIFFPGEMSTIRCPLDLILSISPSTLDSNRPPVDPTNRTRRPELTQPVLKKNGETGCDLCLSQAGIHSLERPAPAVIFCHVPSHPGDIFKLADLGLSDLILKICQL